MSIYLRYAVYYNCQRYLGEIEDLEHLASQSHIVGDFSESRVKTKTVLGGLSTSSEPCREDIDFTDNGDNYNHNNGIHQDGADRGTCNDEHTYRTGSGPEEDISESDEDCSSETSASEYAFKDETPLTAEVSESNSIAESRPRPPKNHCRFPISKPQMEQLLAYHHMLKQIVGSLGMNISLVKKQRDDSASSLMSHLWREAERLQGTEPAKLPRNQTIHLDWWQDVEDSIAESNACPRSCGSPLAAQFTPDDLLWKDAVSKWQLETGRARDEYGRRYVKI